MQQKSPKYSYLGLLIAIGFLFLISPFVQKGVYASMIFELSVFGLLVFAIYSLCINKYIVAIALILGIPASSRAFFTLSPDLELVSICFSALFFLLVILVLLRQLFTSTTVNLNVIYGAICIYILVGIEWGFIYSIMELYSPGTFNLTQLSSVSTEGVSMVNSFIYYSFVTLTTLGYGDITPISQPARSLAIMEAASGQIYLTVLIARLIGMHIAQSNK